MEQTDLKLIHYIRARYMTPPPPPTKPYNLKNTKYEKTPLGKWVRDFYKDKVYRFKQNKTTSRIN
jgi:hypothetical protein